MSEIENHRVTSQFKETKSGDIIRRPSSKTRTATNLGLEKSPRSQSKVVNGEKVYRNPEASRPTLKTYQSVTEGLQAHEAILGDSLVEPGLPLSGIVYSFDSGAAIDAVSFPQESAYIDPAEGEF